MEGDRHFLIVDPYFFIYPAHESIPIQASLARQFIANLQDWADIFSRNNCSIGISPDCINLVKHHKRSILNSKFLLDLADEMMSLEASILHVIQPMATKVKRQIKYVEALNTIDHEQLDYDIEATRIVPRQFERRLPQTWQKDFKLMMANVTYARTQKFYPITAFESVYFVTHSLDGADWVEDNVTTTIEVTYFLEKSEEEKEQSGTNLIEDSYTVIQSAPDFAGQIKEAPGRRTLRDVVEAVHKQYPDRILISKELQNALKKDKNISAYANRIEKALQMLEVWLTTYIRELSGNDEELAISRANDAYTGAISHSISGAGENVQNNPKLLDYRLVRFKQVEYPAFLHIKIFPRIYFTPIPHHNSHAVLVGVIDHHLPTKQH